MGREGWMETIFFFAVSVSQESYCFTASVRSFFPHFCFISLFPPLSSPYICVTISFPSVSLSIRLLPRAPHPCVVSHPDSCPGPAFGVLDLSHVTLTCYVLQGCSEARGPLRKRAALTSSSSSSRKQSETRRGEKESVCEWGDCVGGGSGSSISRHGTPL